jgi:UDP-N-acetylmuramyl pentapeptide synthase
MNAPSWTLRRLAEVLGAELHTSNPERVLRRMATDSRTTQTEPALFWALTTSSGDGHKHLAEAAERGCAAAVVSATGWAAHAVAGLDVLVVDDVWKALYRLAEVHRAAFRGCTSELLTLQQELVDYLLTKKHALQGLAPPPPSPQAPLNPLC